MSGGQKVVHYGKLLEEFTATINYHNPMNARLEGSDYEPEALSILTRFVELSVHRSTSDDEAINTATTIVSDAFSFWFDVAPGTLDLEHMTLELLRVYLSAFPVGESVVEPEEEHS